MKFNIPLQSRIAVFMVATTLFTGLLVVSCKGGKTTQQGVPELNTDTARDSGKLSLIGELNNKIKETSGLAIINNALYTHNDKGRANQLIVMDPQSGAIRNFITISNLSNNDWEDLAYSSDYLFVGDCGNNEGERKNLAIHRINTSKLESGTTQVEASGSIYFTYPEQTSFDVTKKHNFDCEAIFYFNHHIYLCTKNRLDNNTNLYVLPDNPGTYEAKFLASFKSEGRITGADISADGSKIALVGYNKNFDCFLWILEGFTAPDFFGGKATKHLLGQYDQLGQIEAVAFKDSNAVYISSEEIARVGAKLYVYEFK